MACCAVLDPPNVPDLLFIGGPHELSVEALQAEQQAMDAQRIKESTDAIAAGIAKNGGSASRGTETKGRRKEEVMSRTIATSV